MTENIISFIGVFLKHVVGVLLLCWRRMLRAGLVAFAIGVTLTLLVAVISTGQAFPGVLALAVALLFGGALGYGVALTVLIEEFALGSVDLIRLLEGDAKAVAHISETLAEREVGQVGRGLIRLVGLPISAASRANRPIVAPTLPTLPKYPATVSPQRPASIAGAVVEAAATAGAAALASRAAHATPPPSAPATQPPADVATPGDAPEARMGEPVRADHLPRIGWTYEHEAIRPTRSASAPAVDVTPRPQPATEEAEPEADTLAELAGAGYPADAQAEPAATPEPAPQTPLEPMDVSVVSATALGTNGPVAPTLTMDDAPALEDERLAEPASLVAPDDMIPMTPAAEEPGALDPAMLTPAPTTTPLPQDEPALDPAMLVAAPATTPLPQDDPPPATEPEAAPDAPAATLDEAPGETPVAPTRSTFSRITQPVEGLATTMDAISGSSAPPTARASAPESGLWERLSQALINRSGVPSSPFAAPQPSRGVADDDVSDDVTDHSASESDETPQG